MQSPIEMIESLGDLTTAVNRRHHALACEIDEISEQWEALGKHGGVRDDHAATLLGRLRAHLEDIAEFCSVCKGQIDRAVRDPFGRGD